MEYPFSVKVGPQAKPGRYPLFARVSAHRIEPRIGKIELTVKKRPLEEKKAKVAPPQRYEFTFAFESAETAIAFLDVLGKPRVSQAIGRAMRIAREKKERKKGPRG